MVKLMLVGIDGQFLKIKKGGVTDTPPFIP